MTVIMSLSSIPWVLLEHICVDLMFVPFCYPKCKPFSPSRRKNAIRETNYWFSFSSSTSPPFNASLRVLFEKMPTHLFSRSLSFFGGSYATRRREREDMNYRHYHLGGREKDVLTLTTTTTSSREFPWQRGKKSFSILFPRLSLSILYAEVKKKSWVPRRKEMSLLSCRISLELEWERESHPSSLSISLSPLLSVCVHSSSSDISLYLFSVFSVMCIFLYVARERWPRKSSLLWMTCS